MEENTFIWEKPFYYSHSKPFFPKICLDHHLFSEEFNSVKILLDGSLKSDLNWSEEMKIATQFREKNIPIFWEIDLGLSSLHKKLENSSQYLSLKLSIEHFLDVVYREFNRSSLGICLYRGTALINQSLKDFLMLLSQVIPESLPVFFLMDATMQSMEEQLLALSKEHFEQAVLAIKDPLLPLGEYVWKDNVIELAFLNKPSVAVCIPSVELLQDFLKVNLLQTMQTLQEKKIPFRIIPEELLIAEWDELDYLIYSPCFLSAEGKRKIRGFCAAGGTAVTLSEFSNFSQEMTISSLLKIFS